MDSGNSGSMQSSSGGEDQDHEVSQPESVPGYLNSPTEFCSTDRLVHPSLLSHYQNHSHQPTTTTLFDHHLSSNHYNYDDDHHLHTTLSQVPHPNTSNPNFMLNPRSNQPNSTNPRPSSTQPLLASSGQTNAAATPRNPKKRTRASRRAPTTVLTTDTSNFRAMVQEFTGIPAPPFSASSSSSSFSRRLDMFGSGIRSPIYPLRPSAQKVQQSTPFLSSANASNSSLFMMSNITATMVDATNIATTSSNNFSPTYQLLSDHHQNQGFLPNMQNPALTFQSLPHNNQHPPPFHSSSINVANFGVRPSRGVISNLAMHSSLEDQFGMSHGSYGSVGGSIGNSHVAASDGSTVLPLRNSPTDDHDVWRDHGVGSNEGRLSLDHQYLRPTLDKRLEINNANSTTRGDGTVDPWVSPSN